MSEISVSFIIPAYNCANTIIDTVESIFRGNYEDGDEVIIVNDGSTDNTVEIITNIQKKYPVIQLFHHRINKGSAAAGRNTGIDNSNNELLFCLDADNILCSNSIPKLKSHLLKSSSDVVSFGEIHFFKQHCNEVTHKWVFNQVITLADALSGNYWPGPSGNYLFTKTSWLRAGRYNESIGGSFDSLAFGICQLATGSKMVSLPGTYYYHRHGYYSTYLRDYQKNIPSLVLLQVLIPFLQLIDDEDVEYIMSQTGRNTWFENIEQHPIHLKNNHDGKTGYSTGEKSKTIKSILKYAIKKVLPSSFLDVN